VRNDVVLIPPDAEPIEAGWAKTHSRIITSLDDDIIRDQYLSSAREQVENDTGRLFVKQTRKLYLDGFPNVIYFPHNPVRSVVSITYLDQDEVEQTFALSNVLQDQSGEFFRITLDDDSSWPITEDAPGAVRITYRAGYAAPVTVNSSTDVLTSPEHDLENGDSVRIVTRGGTLPTGIEGKSYFVINKTDDTFQISATSGGSAFSFSDTGSSVLVVGSQAFPFFNRMCQAQLLLFGHYYESREAVVDGTISTEVKMGYNSIVNSLSRSLF